MASSGILALRNSGPRLWLRSSLSTLPQSECLQVEEPIKHVYHVRLNRPDKHNALSLQLWSEIGTVFNSLDENSNCRVIVISGNGRSFCSGIDLKTAFSQIAAIVGDESLDAARKAVRVGRFIKFAQDGLSSLENCQKPVIAAIHGLCLGGATSLISAADIRYTTADATFSIKEVDVGLAADVGILQRVHNLVGNDSLTRELSFTARNFTGTEALAYGIVSRTFGSFTECLAASIELGGVIAEKSPIAVQGSKKALNYARSHSVADSLEWVRNWNQAMLQTEDIGRIAMAGQDKKKPGFDDV